MSKGTVLCVIIMLCIFVCISCSKDSSQITQKTTRDNIAQLTEQDKAKIREEEIAKRREEEKQRAQRVQEEVQQAITNWYKAKYNKPTPPIELGIIQFGEANPSQSFIAKFNPKKTYCTTCQTKYAYRTKRYIQLLSRHERDDYMARTGEIPPTKEEEGPLEETTEYDNYIVMLTQSGEMEIMSLSVTYEVWRQTCPFPMKSSSQK